MLQVCINTKIKKSALFYFNSFAARFSFKWTDYSSFKKSYMLKHKLAFHVLRMSLLTRGSIYHPLFVIQALLLVPMGTSTAPMPATDPPSSRPLVLTTAYVVRASASHFTCSVGIQHVQIRLHPKPHNKQTNCFPS